MLFLNIVYSQYLQTTKELKCIHVPYVLHRLNPNHHLHATESNRIE